MTRFLRQPIGGSICRTIVDHENFQIVDRLSSRAGDRKGEVIQTIVCRYDDGTSRLGLQEELLGTALADWIVSAGLLPEEAAMKTIGYVLADFPVFSETFVGDEMRAMSRRGHRVVPLVMHLSDGPAQVDDMKLAKSVTKVGATPLLQALATLARPGRDASAALAFVRRQRRLSRHSLLWNAMKMASVARAAGCEHLHAHFSGGSAAHAIVAARWIDASVSFVCHGHDVYAEAEDLDVKLAAADAVVAVCNDMASDLQSLCQSAKIVTIPCGTDPSLFLPVTGGDRSRRLLFIGRLVEQKGLDDLLTALAMQGSASVDLVGDGPLAGELRAKAASLGLGDRARFLGARSREWIVEHAPRYLALVAPFKIAPDGSRDSGPMVVKEAMAMQLPVVATRFMGLKEMVSPETGFGAEPNDPASLARAIDAAFNLKEEQRAAMGCSARKRMVERFSLDASATALSDVFQAA